MLTYLLWLILLGGMYGGWWYALNAATGIPVPDWFGAVMCVATAITVGITVTRRDENRMRLMTVAAGWVYGVIAAVIPFVAQHTPYFYLSVAAWTGSMTLVAAFVATKAVPAYEQDKVNFLHALFLFMIGTWAGGSVFFNPAPTFMAAIALAIATVVVGALMETLGPRILNALVPPQQR